MRLFSFEDDWIKNYNQNIRGILRSCNYTPRCIAKSVEGDPLVVEYTKADINKNPAVNQGAKTLLRMWVQDYSNVGICIWYTKGASEVEVEIAKVLTRIKDLYVPISEAAHFNKSFKTLRSAKDYVRNLLANTDFLLITAPKGSDGDIVHTAIDSNYYNPEPPGASVPTNQFIINLTAKPEDIHTKTQLKDMGV